MYYFILCHVKKLMSSNNTVDKDDMSNETTAGVEAPFS